MQFVVLMSIKILVINNFLLNFETSSIYLISDI